MVGAKNSPILSWSDQGARLFHGNPPDWAEVGRTSASLGRVQNTAKCHEIL